MSEWLNSKDVCQRCFSGIDDDGDGNCPTCATMTDQRASWMKKTRLAMELSGTGVGDFGGKEWQS